MATTIPGLTFSNGGVSPFGNQKITIGGSSPNALTLSGYNQGVLSGGLTQNNAYNPGALGASSTVTSSAPTQTSSSGGTGDINALFHAQTGGDIAPVGWQPAINASNEAQSAQLKAANTQYDYLASQLQGQLSGLDTQKQNATNEIDTGLSGVQNQIGLSRQNAQTNTDQQIQQAGSIAHSTQQQNRNVLRALGIINSSAAGELLSKPINEFGKQRANIQQALGQRFNELDNSLDQAVKEATNKKNEILANYSQLYSNIQNDLRFNDRQRVDAINSINAAASQHLADIQGQMLNYQNQVNLQKQSFAQQLAQIAAYQNPTIASDYLSQLQLTNNGAGKPTTAAIFQDPNQKKQTLSEH